MCHRFRGLARVDKEGTYRLFHVDETLFSRGPHARVSCRGCHADIDKIPHDNAKPVDCLRSCHIEEPTREILFTHAGVQNVLQDSVHAVTDPNGAVAKSSGGLSRSARTAMTCRCFGPCPSSRRSGRAFPSGPSAGALMCHDDENFTRYFYSHVTTRLHKARDSREVVIHVRPLPCGRGIRPPARAAGCRFQLPGDLPRQGGSPRFDAGAGLPGLPRRRRTACTPCTPRRTRGPPSIRTIARPPATAKDCHATATPALASFDVHANRISANASAGIRGRASSSSLATLGILLPILTLNVLGLVRELLPSQQAEQDLERLTATGGAKERLGKGESCGFTGPAVAACLSRHRLRDPVPDGVPDEIPATAVVAGDLRTLRRNQRGAHRPPRRRRGIAGRICRPCAPDPLQCPTLPAPQKANTACARGLREILALPMIPHWHDLQQLVAYAKYVFFLSPHRPNYGRFSWKEKLEYLGLFWGIPLLGVTGIVLWAESMSSHLFPGWVLNVAYLAHTYESLLAVAHISLVHIPGVLGRPGRVAAFRHGAQRQDLAAGSGRGAWGRSRRFPAGPGGASHES